MLNPQVLNNYFNDLNALMTQLSIHDKPENIWNCDETGKQFEHQPVRVLAEKGAKSVVGRASPGRTNITVMACVSASGKQMPPLFIVFIVKGKTSRSFHGFNNAAAPTGSKWHFQPNGWMTDEIGEMWFSDVFLKECGEARPPGEGTIFSAEGKGTELAQKSVYSHFTIFSDSLFCLVFS